MGMIKKFWSENVNGRDHLENLGVDGKLLSEYIFERYGGKLWTRFG
jgi:hypothetical protein